MLPIILNLKTYKNNVLKHEIEGEVVSEADPTGNTVNEVKMRGFVLTNKFSYSAYGSCYSDNTLTLSVRYPNAISTGTPYAKGSIVSYTSNVEGQGNIKWILKAKEEIPLDWKQMDFSKWDVDTVAMNVSLMDQEREYNVGDLAYEIENNEITLMKVYYKDNVTTLWTDEIDIDEDNVYSYINIELKYDIGVM